jgi:hypothetical protein
MGRGRRGRRSRGWEERSEEECVLSFEGFQIYRYLVGVRRERGRREEGGGRARTEDCTSKFLDSGEVFF